MKQSKNKRTFTEVRKYIEVRAARENAAITRGGAGMMNASLGSDGARITGPDLQRAAQAIDLIPDKVDRRTVHGMFSSFTKYQTLGMLTNPSGKWMKDYAEIVAQIADEATFVDAVAYTSSDTVGKFGG